MTLDQRIDLTDTELSYPRLEPGDLNGTVEALIRAVEIKDQETCRHLYRAAVLANACLEQVDADQASDPQVNFGFLLHDVGKIGVPDEILCKKGPLGYAEWQQMRMHPEIGISIIEPVGFAPCVTDVILHHHERWDGAGYPYRLAGTDIPITARVFAVADAYDAMTSDRPYRAAMSKNEALSILSRGSGSRYDPDVVSLFIDLAL